MMAFRSIGIWYVIIQAAFGGENADSPYPWRDQDRYYFNHFKTKMADIMSPKCFESMTNTVKDKHDDISLLDEVKTGSEIHGIDLEPESKFRQWWAKFKSPRQMRTDPLFCDRPAKLIRPIFAANGCQLPGNMHRAAPRCQPKYLKWACDKSRAEYNQTRTPGFVLPESNHLGSKSIPPRPYLVVAKKALVTSCGRIVKECGLVAQDTGCASQRLKKIAGMFAKRCDLHTLEADVSRADRVQEFYNCTLSKMRAEVVNIKGSPAPMPTIKYVPRVFVAAQKDDTHIYHIHLEIIPRIVYHREWLLKNPDVKILLGCDTAQRGKGTEFKKRTRAALAFAMQSIMPLLELAGIPSERLLMQTSVYADEVYLPMEGACQDPVFNTWQLLYMRQFFMSKLNLDPWATGRVPGKKPILMLVSRSPSSRHTRNHADLVRQWNPAFISTLTDRLRSAFPECDVELFADTNYTLMSSQANQIVKAAHADVLIGVHGAGLSNQIYQRPNSAAVEIGPYINDGRILLGGGPFSRIAVVMSHDYMLHHPPFEKLKFRLKSRTADFDISDFLTHLNSFLVSIDLIPYKRDRQL
jgi:hypothetical protein